jgi:dethiobiotin synthetase
VFVCERKGITAVEGYFITGTDTDVGKTWVTLALMEYFKQQGKTVVGMKPVAAGCVMHDGQLKNEDALLIQAHSSVDVTYELVNPYAYALPASPHIAGKINPVVIGEVLTRFEVLKHMADVILVEGAGGWLAPINNRQDISDLARVLALPVIMVVAIRLGCINHAKLTFQAILHSGLQCVGWIAVCTDSSMLAREENIHTLSVLLDSPLLGVMPYTENVDFNGLAACFHW